MSTLVYMKLLEQNPAKYDRGMRILTLGRINRIKKEIASSWIESASKVLEIGCGTGTLAALITAQGSHVLGTDISEEMLNVARENAPKAEFKHMTATEIEVLGKNRFDCVVATLSLSELSNDELDYVLRSTKNVLKQEGRLIVADEVIPKQWWERMTFHVIRWPLAALTFLLTQNTTHTLKGFESRIQRHGYEIKHMKRYLSGSLALMVMEKCNAQ